MLSNMSVFKYKIGDRQYIMLCEQDSPTSEVKEVLFQWLGHIANIEKQAMEQAKQAKTELPIEDVSSEPPRE